MPDSDPTYADQLSAIASPIAAVDANTAERIRRFEAALSKLPRVDRTTIAELLPAEPDSILEMASVVGLSQERLKGALLAGTGSASWITRARTEPETLVEYLDREFDIVAALDTARTRDYTLADVLLARASRGAGAAAGIESGRQLEDMVEQVIRDLGLEFEPRTRYVGRANQDGPADFAIPAGGKACEMAIGVKGFDSTGSKLTAAVDEIRRMADVRLPTQFIYVVVDGTGWLRRRGDLGRLEQMVEQGEIDGMYSQRTLPEFRNALHGAAVRLGILPP